MKNLLTTVFILLSIENLNSQWVQQILPELGTCRSIVFLNTNTGVIFLDNPFVLRTTNAGTSWTNVRSSSIMTAYKIDSSSIYGCGYTYYNPGSIWSIYRSTNYGLSWDSTSYPRKIIRDISFINRNTGWVCGADSTSNNYIWMTTDGGRNLNIQRNLGPNPLRKIFILKNSINGNFIGWCVQSTIIWKTTNSGTNWDVVSHIGLPYPYCVQFFDQNTGYVDSSFNRIAKTTNGGTNWTSFGVTPDSAIYFPNINCFDFINPNLGWGTGGSIRTPYEINLPVIWKTTNGGLNWGYSVPDTFFYGAYSFGALDFIDSLNGWVTFGAPVNYVYHTTNGGGPIRYIGITQVSDKVPMRFELYQNYPNPFNPATLIKFDLPKSGYLKFRAYDILGKQVYSENEYVKAGTSQFEFDGSNLASGIYIYSVEAGDVVLTKKMVLLK